MDGPEALPDLLLHHRFQRAAVIRIGRIHQPAVRAGKPVGHLDEKRQGIIDSWPALMNDRGWQAETAREIGVHRAAVCRDVDAILSELGITFQLLRGLTWTPKEKHQLAKLGIVVS